MVKRIINSNSGFSLLEVMIALAIFGVYAVVIILTQSNNVSSSLRLSNDLQLHNLAQLKMNETMVMAKEFTNATENDPETGSFEIEGFEHFKYKVEFKKNEFPNFAQIMGKEDEDEQSSDSENTAVQKLIFDKMKKNIEEMIWQVKVTVTNTQDDTSYELSSWISKQNAKIDTNFSF